MRLTRQEEEIATRELLGILGKHPEGMSTSNLSGTPKFHGTYTLRNRQIIRLLRKTGKVRESVSGSGNRTFSGWQIGVQS